MRACLTFPLRISNLTDVKRLALLLVAAMLLTATGCSMAYHTNGDKANLTELAPPDIQEAFRTQPSYPLPASIAMVRVQASGYTNHNIRKHGGTYGSGSYSVVLVREVEEQQQLDRLLNLPEIQGLVGLNRMLLTKNLTGIDDLRLAAANLKADLLLLYTFDTAFFDKDHASPVTVISLGLAPTQTVRATTTASAMLVDTRTGYIYSVYEATQQNERLTNTWDNADRADEARLKSERLAFEKLVDEFVEAWPTHLTKANAYNKAKAEQQNAVQP